MIVTEVDYAIAYVVVMENVMPVRRGRKLKAQSLATNGFRKMAQKWYLVHHHGSPIMSSEPGVNGVAVVVQIPRKLS